MAGYVAGQDLSQRNSGYNLAYKPQGGAGWVGIIPNAWDDSQVFGATGAFPDGTLNPNNNGHANVYAQTNGYPVVFNGLTVTGAAIDKCHLEKFLERQFRLAVAQVFVTRRKIPFDDARGRNLILNALSRIMNAAQAAGHFTNDPVDWENIGPYLRKGTGWVLRGESFSAQSAARRGARLAPVITPCYVCAGAINHVPIQLCSLAVPESIAQL